eukprot:GFKZ01005775.1.p1 GENE.GFKZ01005775.1~~GFKZ01005775.1.p1  ORF type:complete len:506 (-),score=93.41 GFKZ01005775.1:271-1788(-)
MGSWFSSAPMLPQSVPPGSTGQSLDNDYHMIAHYTNPVVYAMDEVLKNKIAELKSLISSFEKDEKDYAAKVTDLANRAKDAQNRQLEIMYIVGSVVNWSESAGNLEIKEQLQSFDQKPYEYAQLATTISSAAISIVAMFVPGGSIVAVVVPMIGAVISDGIQLGEVNNRIDQVNGDKKKLDSEISSHETEISNLNSQIDKLNADLDAFDQRAFKVLNVKSWEEVKSNQEYSGIFKENVMDMKDISTKEDALRAASAIANHTERNEFMALYYAKTKLVGQIGQINASIQKASVTSRSLPFLSRFAATKKVGLAQQNDKLTSEEQKIVNHKFKAAILSVFNVARPLSVAITSAAELLRVLAKCGSAVDTSKLEKSLDGMITLFYGMKTEFEKFSNNWANVASERYNAIYNALEALEKASTSIQDQFMWPLKELLHFVLSTRPAWKWDEMTHVAFENNILAVGSGAHKPEVESVIQKALPQIESNMRTLMAGILTDTVPIPQQLMAMS